MTRSAVEAALQDPDNRDGIPFGRFMELALYGDGGYYSTHVEIGTRAGDFYTAAQSPLFAAALAEAVSQLHQRWGLPQHIQVVEFGAGQGELAAALGQELALRLPRVGLTYTIVERSDRLRRVQAQRLRAHSVNGLRYIWGTAVATLPTVVIANEVLDALPVERVLRSGDRLQQAWVRARVDGGLELVWRQAAPQVVQATGRWLPIGDGTMGEVCLSLESFFLRLAAGGQPFCAWLIDYGMSAGEWASGVRPLGTVRGYKNHQLTDPLEGPGRQDITADVNWDHACAAAESAGLTVVGLSTQGAFLMNHGIMEAYVRLSAAGATGTLRGLQLSGELKQLTLPGGMGDRFQVLECIR